MRIFLQFASESSYASDEYVQIIENYKKEILNCSSPNEYWNIQTKYFTEEYVDQVSKLKEAILSSWDFEKEMFKNQNKMNPKVSWQVIKLKESKVQVREYHDYGNNNSYEKPWYLIKSEKGEWKLSDH